jgi:hypothetical protein
MLKDDCKGAAQMSLANRELLQSLVKK